MVRQSEEDGLSFFFPVCNCRIVIAAGEGKSTYLFTYFLFSTLSIFVLVDYPTKTLFGSLRQSLWLTRVISNCLDIPPKQDPLWENIQY